MRDSPHSGALSSSLHSSHATAWTQSSTEARYGGDYGVPSSSSQALSRHRQPARPILGAPIPFTALNPKSDTWSQSIPGPSNISQPTSAIPIPTRFQARPQGQTSTAIHDHPPSHLEYYDYSTRGMYPPPYAPISPRVESSLVVGVGRNDESPHDNHHMVQAFNNKDDHRPHSPSVQVDLNNPYPGQYAHSCTYQTESQYWPNAYYPTYTANNLAYQSSCSPQSQDLAIPMYTPPGRMEEARQEWWQWILDGYSADSAVAVNTVVDMCKEL